MSGASLNSHPLDKFVHAKVALAFLCMFNLDLHVAIYAPSLAPRVLNDKVIVTLFIVFTFIHALIDELEAFGFDRLDRLHMAASAFWLSIFRMVHKVLFISTSAIAPCFFPLSSLRLSADFHHIWIHIVVVIISVIVVVVIIFGGITLVASEVDSDKGDTVVNMEFDAVISF